MDKKSLRQQREEQYSTHQKKKSVKMYDAGEKMSDMIDSPMKERKDKKYYPSLRLEAEQFPEISKMKTGKKYSLIIEVKPTRISENQREGQEIEQSADLEVLKVGMM